MEERELRKNYKKGVDEDKGRRTFQRHLFRVSVTKKAYIIITIISTIVKWPL